MFELCFQLEHFELNAHLVMKRNQISISLKEILSFKEILFLLLIENLIFKQNFNSYSLVLISWICLWLTLRFVIVFTHVYTHSLLYWHIYWACTAQEDPCTNHLADKYWEIRNSGSNFKHSSWYFHYALILHYCFKWTQQAFCGTVWKLEREQNVK